MCEQAAQPIRCLMWVQEVNGDKFLYVGGQAPMSPRVTLGVLWAGLAGSNGVGKACPVLTGPFSTAAEV